MPYEFNLEKAPAGYAASAAGPGDNVVAVKAVDFFSTEDGQQFVRCLEGFPDEILSKIAEAGPRIPPSKVDHMLALIQANGGGAKVGSVTFFL